MNCLSIHSIFYLFVTVISAKEKKNTITYRNMYNESVMEDVEIAKNIFIYYKLSTFTMILISIQCQTFSEKLPGSHFCSSFIIS
jgi:hypothetical protein